jgi:hypothetical protein
MAEPYARAASTLDDAVSACTLCGEPTVGVIADDPDAALWPEQFPCCPACSYGVEEGELHALLRAAARGPN